jgi:hypothetical protein
MLNLLKEQKHKITNVQDSIYSCMEEYAWVTF